MVSCGDNSSTKEGQDSDSTATAVGVETDGAEAETIDATEERPAGLINPLEEADAIVADVNQYIDSYTQTSDEAIVEEVNACNLTTYTSANGTQKKVVADCYDGNRMARVGSVYYLNDQPLYLELKVETFNASPSNLAAFDESETKVKQHKLYLKDGQLDEYIKVVDENGEEVTTLDDNTKEDIAIIVEGLK